MLNARANKSAQRKKITATIKTEEAETEILTVTCQ